MHLTNVDGFEYSRSTPNCFKAGYSTDFTAINELKKARESIGDITENTLEKNIKMLNTFLHTRFYELFVQLDS